MSNSFSVKGWCPGALRPMLAGDGYVVRLRPKEGVLNPEQAHALAQMARLYGNGIMTLTSRANIQLRGVTDVSFTPLIENLGANNLIDYSIRTESQRNIILSPFWQAGDRSQCRLSMILINALGAKTAPILPDKFGFVLDIAGAPHLRAASGDVRIERTKEAGHFWVYADGASTGWRGPQAKVIKAAMDLAKWFVEKGGMSNGRGRMRTLMQSLPTMPEDFTTHLQLLPPAQMPNLGLCDQGLLVGLRFGNLSADLLDILADQGELRLTPWRMVLVAGAKALAAHPDLIIDPRDPSLRIEACIGAPACNQAHGTTYDMAQRLTHILPVGRFAHISGCAKGCARTGNCDLTIVAQEGGYAWGKKVCADDIMGPALSKDFLLKDIQATFESPNNV